eukprot:CAMPEP_0197074164 /NCGR_PEP_ID=MMETSP1384-20130603/210970_1 /TAXON_ID=29189 /ORGANISM="Ammonia sp." /LENGTH=582 /DNA_ID=CAMNT_0042513005 /DNA_START=42 /DNA_END=1787 /DNA_ORIENTATION=+
MAFTYQPQAAHVSSDEQLVCSACRVAVLPNERHSHYRSDWHRYNVKRKCVAMEPIDKAVFEAKLNSIIASGQQIESVSNKKKKKALNKTLQKNYDTLISNDQWQISTDNTRQRSMDELSSLLTYRCTLCHKTFKTHQQCVSHLSTKKHRAEFIAYHKNLRQQQQEEINVYHATNAEQPNAEQNAQPSMDNLVPVDELKPVLSIENNPFITVRKAKLSQKHRGVHVYDEEAKRNEGQTQPANDNNDNNEDNNNNNKQAARVALDACKQCLFCSTSCASQEESIQHMSDEHGFFIPFAKRVISVEAMLQCAGQIIGEFHQCVWCWKIFKSVGGVQTHMRHTGHCKLQVECAPNITYCRDAEMNVNKAVVNEEEDSPFVRFIDFEKVLVDSDEDEQEVLQMEVDEDGGMLGREVMVSEKRHITDINESAELVREEDSPFVRFIDFEKVVVDSDEDEQEVLEMDEDGGMLGREVMVSEKRHVTDINESAELVRNDGTVIGHRDHMLVYRQKHRNLAKYHETQTEEQIIAQINNPQRKIKLEEMERKKNAKEFEESGARQQSKGVKGKEHEAMNLQARQHKVVFQNW